jgi:hypothetical protein
MRYWYRRSNGFLLGEFTHGRKGHSDFDVTPDLADIPGPISACRWDGAAVVVDATRLAAVKTELRRQIEEKAFVDLQEGVLTTPFGDFRVRKDDIDAYQMIGFAAIYAIQTGGAFSATVRTHGDTNVTVTAAQFVRLLALIGDRMAARLSSRDTRLNQLAAATPEQLKGFAP